MAVDPQSAKARQDIHPGDAVFPHILRSIIFFHIETSGIIVIASLSCSQALTRPDREASCLAIPNLTAQRWPLHIPKSKSATSLDCSRSYLLTPHDSLEKAHKALRGLEDKLEEAAKIVDQAKEIVMGPRIKAKLGEISSQVVDNLLSTGDSILTHLHDRVDLRKRICGHSMGGPHPKPANRDPTHGLVLPRQRRRPHLSRTHLQVARRHL